MFKKLSLKFKILMIIIPSALALMAASSFIINYYYQQGKEMDGFVQVTDAFDDFGKLIDHLQKERGMSGQYLAKKLTLDELNAHRKEKTDEELKEVRKMLTLIPFHADDLKDITEAFSHVEVIRKKIDNYEVSFAESIKSYIFIIERLLVTEGRAAAIYSGKGIEMKLINITVVESLKEHIGRTRAVFSAIFAKNVPLSLSELSKAEYTEGAISVVAESSTLELVPSLLNKIRNILNTPEWMALEKDFDVVMEKSSKGDYGVDAKDFFTRISTIITKFNGILGEERESLVKEAEEEAAKAHKMFYLVVAGVLVAIVAIIAFSSYVLKDLVQKEATEAVANTAAMRSSSMVDNSPISTMMCDPSGTLIYMNQSTIENLKKLQQYLPEKVDNLIGKSIDIFHKDPAVQRKIISDPRNLPHKAVIALGPEKLDLLVIASIDSSGKYLGAALSWSIVTAKVELIKDLTKSADDLSSAASNVLAISNNLSAAAEETSAQANTASVASEEVNAGVQTVASNMEEMVAAIKEITKTTNEAASMTNEAMSLARNANQIINKLGDSSMDIGNVIKVISSIAQQTNLLALNATIEAARAGEAGKGFAVVANEVKELANQTAKATSEITKKIETIQGDSKNAVDAIAEISSAIEKVNGYTGNIAASVEEQAATTNEVTRIVTESAEGVKQISENVSQVSLAAANTGRDAGNAQGAARGVGDIANLLKKYVDRLKVE